MTPMFRFLRYLFEPPQSLTQIKAEKFFSREALGIAPYPEDPKVTAILSEIRQALKALPQDHKRTAVTIELSASANEAIINLERARALHGLRPDPEWAISCEYSLYGYQVEILPDDQMSGKDARVVYIPQ